MKNQIANSKPLKRNSKLQAKRDQKLIKSEHQAQLLAQADPSLGQENQNMQFRRHEELMNAVECI